MTWDELVTTVAEGGPCQASALGGTLSGRQVTALLAAAPLEPGTSRRVLTGADFRGVTFVDPVSFTGVRFSTGASFDHARFDGHADFNVIDSQTCTFKGAAFRGTLYVGYWTAHTLRFEDATFERLARFYNVTADELTFSGSTFRARSVFGDIRATSFLNYVGTTFVERVGEFVAGCRYLHLQKARLERGGVFYLHGGQVELAGAEFSAATMVAGSRKSGSFRNQDVSLVVDGGGWKPRLLSLEGANVESLVLQDVDLSRCRFTGAMRLDALRLEGSCEFDTPPLGAQMSSRPPFVWAWTRRQSIFEERLWRAHGRTAKGWRPPRAPRKPGEPLIISAEGDPFVGAAPTRAERRAQAEQFAKTYRALRKGREDVKNEPGAGDFYYGEMEMRRAGTGAAGERFVLWLYWLSCRVTACGL
jgi:uncharacterized protein YjbI with pentapeptide repeats